MTRTSALMLLVLAALAAPAIAQPTPAPPAPTPAEPAPVAHLQPPVGWVNDDERAGALVKSLAEEEHFGGVPIGLDAQFMRSPTPGAVLITNQVVTETLPADPAAAATLELHAAREGADAVDGAKIVRWEVHVDPAGRVHEALLEWTDPTIGTTVVSRTLVFRTKSDIAKISAECILGPDAADQRAACETALQSMGPNVTANDLVPIAVSAQPPAVSPAAAVPPGSGTAPSAPTIGERDGSLPSTIMVRPAPPRKDRRPFYVIGGLLLLGAAYWWNRRERERREAEKPEASESDTAPATVFPPSPAAPAVPETETVAEPKVEEPDPKDSPS